MSWPGGDMNWHLMCPNEDCSRLMCREHDPRFIRDGNEESK